MFSRLSRNSMWLMLARLGTQLGMALFTILLARRLGSAVFGEYAFIAAVVVIGNVVTTFGTDMLLIREIAATDTLSQLAPALVIQLSFSTLFIAGVFATSSLIPIQGSDAVVAMRIYSFSLIPLAFYTVFTTALRGTQHMASYTILNLALIALQVSVALWLARIGGGLVALSNLLLLVQMIAAGLAAILCWIRIPRVWQIWQFSERQVWPLFKASAPIALLGILGIVYQRLSLLMLPLVAGTAVTGWFSTAARIVEAAKFGHVAVFTALYPVMAQANVTDRSNWSRTFRLPSLLLLGGAVVASLVLSSLARPLVLILFGADYTPSVPVLQILSWMLIPYTINTFLSLKFLTRRYEKIILYALIAGIFTLGILTAWWEPLAGPPGAATAALCAEIVQSIILVAHNVHQSRFASAATRCENSVLSG